MLVVAVGEGKGGCKRTLRTSEAMSILGGLGRGDFTSGEPNNEWRGW